MSYVKYRKKGSSTIYVYESESHYDPVSKQSRPKRKLVGIWDEATQSIIPTSGKKGRKPKSESLKTVEADNSRADRIESRQNAENNLLLHLQNQNRKLEESILSLEEKVRRLEAENVLAKKVLTEIEILSKKLR